MSALLSSLRRIGDPDTRKLFSTKLLTPSSTTGPTTARIRHFVCSLISLTSCFPITRRIGILNDGSIVSPARWTVRMSAFAQGLSVLWLVVCLCEGDDWVRKCWWQGCWSLTKLACRGGFLCVFAHLLGVGWQKMFFIFWSLEFTGVWHNFVMDDMCVYVMRVFVCVWYAK